MGTARGVALLTRGYREMLPRIGLDSGSPSLTDDAASSGLLLRFNGAFGLGWIPTRTSGRHISELEDIIDVSPFHQKETKQGNFDLDTPLKLFENPNLSLSNHEARHLLLGTEVPNSPGAQANIVPEAHQCISMTCTVVDLKFGRLGVVDRPTTSPQRLGHAQWFKSCGSAP